MHINSNEVIDLNIDKSPNISSKESKESIIVPKIVDLDEGEKPVLLARQHWFVFRDPVLIALFIPLVLVWARFMIVSLGWVESLQPLLTFVLHKSALFFFILGFLMFVWKHYLWRNTFYLITTMRVVLVKKYGLFHHDDRETGLNMVQDVKADINGVQASLYGFGDVIVQVSSQDAKLILEKVGKPRDVQKVIVREAHLRER